MSCCGAFVMQIEVMPKLERSAMSGLPRLDPASKSGGATERQLTGRHVLIMIVLFFAVIISVNMVMMTLAIRTMPGVEIKSSYESSQRFNSELDAIVAQDQRGWQVEIATGDSHTGKPLRVSVRDQAGEPISGLIGHATLKRPTDKRLDQTVTLSDIGGGRYEAASPALAAGQWDLVVEFMRGQERHYASRRRILVKE